MVDERTPGLGLQMPHPDNRLEVDVLRLRAAITALDAACETLAGVLETKVSTQELATAVAGLQGSINNLGTTVAFLTNTKVGLVNGLAGPAVVLSPVHLGLGPANGPSSIAVTRDAQGRLATVTALVDGKNALTTMAYDAQGRVGTVTTAYDGRTRTQTCTYNAQGQLASMAAVETGLRDHPPRLAGHSLPDDSDSGMMPLWPVHDGPDGAPPSLSAREVLAGSPALARLKGRIVVIGRDDRSTPRLRLPDRREISPAEALARRKAVDEAGVVHHYHEVLLGEAMEHGPVMLSWPAVDGAGRHGATSVVIHEFMHKIDMRNGPADGCPPLPAGFLGQAGARNAHAAWQAAWQPAYEQFREQVIIAERFGGDWPWLDAYGATAPAEFFAVACEAHFVQPERFALEFPELSAALRAFFKQK